MTLPTNVGLSPTTVKPNESLLPRDIENWRDERFGDSRYEGRTYLMFFEIGDITIDGRDLFIAVFGHLFVTQFSDIFL